MKIAAVASESSICNIKQNLETTISWIEKLNKQGADFILFPELNLSGYTKKSTILNDVLKQKDAIFNKLISISEKSSAAFAIGFPEKSEDKYFISHFLFHNGKLVGVHQKTHLGSSEKEVFVEGNEINVFQVGKLKIGIQLCFETHYPEISYAQAKQGANVLALAFASPRENSKVKLERFKRYLPARAYDNNCFVVACNLQQKSKLQNSERNFPGLSLILAPKGKVLQQTISEEKGFVVVDVDLAEIERIKQSRMAHFNKEKRVELFQKYYTQNEFNEEDKL